MYSASDRSVLALLSGGLDSSIVCLYLREKGHRVVPLFISYAQRAQSSEWQAARSVAKKLGLESPRRLDLRSFGRTLEFALVTGARYSRDQSFDQRFQNSFLPHRNLWFATCAAMQAASLGLPAIAMGIVGGTDIAYPDTTPMFLRKLRAILKLSADVRVLAPFASKSKLDVARFGWERDFDYGVTYSCHVQSGVHCGKCAGCIERDQTLAEYPPMTRTRYASRVPWELA